ncbi:hypothetical protein ACOVZ9_003044, partial [Acinetobacter baumannii]
MKCSASPSEKILNPYLAGGTIKLLVKISSSLCIQNSSVTQIGLPAVLPLKNGEFKHEVRQFQKPYDNQQAE